MVANFAGLGILAAIAAHRGGREGAEPFRVPMRYLGGTLGMAALVIVGVLLHVQVVRADDYAVKPHLSVQGDGVARYQYNPRVLDAGPVAAARHRRSIAADACWRPATRELAQRARAPYQKLGIAPDGTCVDPVERCYPLGGAAFHVLGQRRHPRELGREQQRLRRARRRRPAARVRRPRHVDAFDGRRRHVRSGGAPGLPRAGAAPAPSPSARSLGREGGADPRPRRPHHDRRPAAGARRADPRRGASARSATGHAAAVVLDPATGDVLALASYPLPVVDRPDAAGQRRSRRAVPRSRALRPLSAGLDVQARDRGRGAAAGPGAATPDLQSAARCPTDASASRIPGGRGRCATTCSIRHPHGTIDMHDGLVLSCNAYFAQLAVRARAPRRCSTRRRRSGSRSRRAARSSGCAARCRTPATVRATCVASPLRMARVAAAHCQRRRASRAARRDRPGAPVKRERLLSPQAAATLARDMRDGVLEGTGRGLAAAPDARSPARPAPPKSTGAPSHSWFVGFAPYGGRAREAHRLRRAGRDTPDTAAARPRRRRADRHRGR